MSASSSQSQKIVLITGCSSGFGLMTAARLSASGFKVYASMRDVGQKSALLSEVNKRGGAAVTVLPLDVTDLQSITEALQHISEDSGCIDILVNNAGYGIGGAFEDLSDQEMRQQFETNFFGVLNVTRQAIPLMRQRAGAKIINLSSVSGFSGAPCFSAYVASKWALEGFSECLRYELKLFDIDVCLIQPGTYKTEIFYKNRKYAEKFHNSDSPYYDLSQELNKRVDEQLEQSKADPEQVAELIEKVIRSKSPGFRNRPDMQTRIMWRLRKVLPFRLYSWIIQQAVMKDVLR